MEGLQGGGREREGVERGGGETEGVQGEEERGKRREGDGRS